MRSDLRDDNETIDGVDKTQKMECPECGHQFDPDEQLWIWCKAEIEIQNSLANFDGYITSRDIDNLVHHEHPEAKCPNCGEYVDYNWYDEVEVVD